MIKYNLACKCGKNFESWFSSSSEYDSLRKRKFLSCIYCNSTSVKKSIMAPNLSGKTNKKNQESKQAKNLKKQLTYADKRNSPVAVICGETEFKEKKVTLKKLKKEKSEDNQITISKDNLINEIKKLI